jgi:hypothetical protein
MAAALEQAHAAEQQHRAEDVDHPFEPVQQLGAGGDETAAQH